MPLGASQDGPKLGVAQRVIVSTSATLPGCRRPGTRGSVLNHQSLTAQRDALTAASCERIFTDRRACGRTGRGWRRSIGELVRCFGVSRATVYRAPQDPVAAESGSALSLIHI